MIFAKVLLKKEYLRFVFTEHFSVDPTDVSYNVLDYNRYHKEIEECKEAFKKQAGNKKKD